jgi:flagellar biosynthetic protein FlhB
MADSYQEKSEQPTEKRLEDARKKGQVAQSPEVASCFIILFLSLFFYYSISKGFNRMFATYTSCIQSLNIEVTVESVSTILNFAVHQWLVMVVPVFALLIVLGLASTFAQTGFNFSWEAIMPKLETLNPINGIKKLFTVRSLLELVKSVLKILILAYIIYIFVKDQLAVILSLADQNAYSIVCYIAHTAFSLALKVGGVFLFLAGLDYARQRWQQKKDLMMTTQEVKEEFKEREGSPQVKSRIRSLQRDIARRRMIEDVKKADVVLTNPTSYAVAIMYTPKQMPAPKVVAKGGGFVAERIKQVARSHGVAIIENKPVARALFFAVKVGDFVPENFYLIVAEVLAQVYKKRNKVVM